MLFLCFLNYLLCIFSFSSYCSFYINIVLILYIHSFILLSLIVCCFCFKIVAFVIPLFSAFAYFLLPNPITLLLIAGIWAALGLPIINIGALYLTSQLSEELQPKPITKIILWITLILQVSMATLILYSQITGFN